MKRVRLDDPGRGPSRIAQDGDPPDLAKIARSSERRSPARPTPHGRPRTVEADVDVAVPPGDEGREAVDGGRASDVDALAEYMQACVAELGHCDCDAVGI